MNRNNQSRGKNSLVVRTLSLGKGASQGIGTTSLGEWTTSLGEYKKQSKQQKKNSLEVKASSLEEEKKTVLK